MTYNVSCVRRGNLQKARVYEAFRRVGIARLSLLSRCHNIGYDGLPVLGHELCLSG